MPKKSRGLRLCALMVAWTMFFSLHVPVPVYAAPSLPPTSLRSLTADVTAIRIPAQIGEIQEFYRGSQDKILILVQDAHSIPDAQNSIRALISFFQTQYGVDLTLVEGTSESYDPQIFRSFPDADLLKKTFKQYLADAELTGTTAAAIFNADEGYFEGIEDWQLYEQGIEFYLNALGVEEAARQKLASFVKRLESVKTGAYSENLLRVDDAVGQFRQDQMDLIKLLRTLNTYQAPPALNFSNGSA